jgi:hypothetical protein
VKSLILYSAIVASSLLIVGCGDSANDVTNSLDTTDITVERGPVLNAVVVDSDGQIGEHIGNGVYRFIEPQYPIQSYGGYIDMDRDSVVSAGDIEMKQLRLRSKSGEVMTLATTLDENLIDTLLGFGFSEEELSNDIPSSNKDIAALSDEIYMYCYENNISDPADINLTQMLTLQNRIQERQTLYRGSELDASELEDDLMEELDVDILNNSDLDNITTNVMDTIINATPLAQLSDEQKYTIAYMWNEEKMAKDIYLALNDLTASNTFENIATKAETSHMEAVESLVKKYDLNILNIDGNYTGSYDSSVLETYQSGEFNITEISELYNTLYEKGSNSLQDAFEVGCMVEVADVNDLNDDIEIVEGAEDLTVVFESLRKGSYSHYWAFDKALKNIGVSDGCCTLGDEYCKTIDEYPIDENKPGHGNK